MGKKQIEFAISCNEFATNKDVYSNSYLRIDAFDVDAYALSEELKQHAELPWILEQIGDDVLIQYLNSRGYTVEEE